MALYPLSINESLNDGQRLSYGPFTLVNPLRYIDYFRTGRGLLSDNYLRAGAFINTDVNQDKLKRPDIQIHTFPYAIDLDFGLGIRHAFSFSDEGFFSLHEDSDSK